MIRCHQPKNIFSHVIPCKGPDDDKFVANLIVQAIQGMGHVKIILKSDNEKAVLAVVARALMSIRCTVDGVDGVTSEQSAKYDSQSNGATEAGINISRGQIRTHKLCLEARIGKEIPPTHAMTSWILEHVALLHAACVRGDDGLTGWSRVRGRPFGN